MSARRATASAAIATTTTRTTNPPHAAAGFPTTCETCHRPTDPGPGVTAAPAASTTPPCSRWSATTHTAACATCHVNNVYKGTPRDCVGCHRALYIARRHRSMRPLASRPMRHLPPAARPSVTAAPASITTPCSSWSAACAAGLRHLSQEQRLQGHAAGLRRLPPHRLRAHDVAEPRRRRLPDQLRHLPPLDRRSFGGATLQPQQRLPAGRRARDAGLRDLPREQRLQGHAARLRRLPPRRLRPDDIAEPRGGRLPDHCDSCHGRPTAVLAAPAFNHNTVFPLVGLARDAGLRDLPREQRLQGHAARLRRLPPDQLRPDDDAEPRRGRLPDHCESCHRPTDATWATAPRSTTQRLRAGRHARHAGLRDLPREQRLQGHAARLRRLPPDQLPRDDDAAPRRGRLLDHVRLVPPADRRAPGRAPRSTTTACSRWSACTRRRPARPAT